MIAIPKTVEDDININHFQFEEMFYSSNGDPFERIVPPILSFTEQNILLRNKTIDFKDVSFLKQNINPAGYGDDFGCTGELVIISSGRKFPFRLKCVCDIGGHEVDSFITALKTAFRKVKGRMKPDKVWQDDSNQWKIDTSNQHTNNKSSSQDKVEKETRLDLIQISVRNTSGESITFAIEADSSVNTVKSRIKDVWQIHPNAQRLIFLGRELRDGMDLLEYNIVDGSTLQLSRRIATPIKTIIVLIEDGQSIQLDVKPTDTIRSVKANIQDRIQVHPSYQCLLFSGDALDDGRLLSYYNTEEYNLRDMSRLHLVIDSDKAQKVIADLIRRAIARQKRRSAIIIQKHLRGISARIIYSSTLQPHLEDVRHFYAVWKNPLEQVPHSVPALTGWTLVRDRMDLKRVDLLDENGNLAETDDKLDEALKCALKDDYKANVTEEVEQCKEKFSDLAIKDEHSCSKLINTESIDWSQFQVTSHVVKFMKNGDSKYREIFVKRILQLAKGERSHKLQKPLKGCESIICEYTFVLFLC